MSHLNPIQPVLTELYPDLNLPEWRARDQRLQENGSSRLRGKQKFANRQAYFLAEEVVLDSFMPDRLVEGISRYMQHYVDVHFPQDAARHDAVARTVQDGSTNQPNADSAELHRLLTTPLSRIDRLAVDGAPMLNELRNIQAPTRVGDVVFLPKDAELVVIGDTHGDLTSTRQIIREIESGRATSGKPIIVFLGDYMHNGVRSWANLLEVLRFQEANPESVILLSGNHEFRETLRTALNEFLNKHWNRFADVPRPSELHNRVAGQDNHYGHMRLDLARSFGYAEGERLYRAVQEWGIGLPWICLSDQLMLSHSLGKPAGMTLDVVSLLRGKRDGSTIRQMGPEVWGARRGSVHSAMVNNRIMTEDLLANFRRVLGVTQFVVGHCHYRSGDTAHYGQHSVTTVVSSDPFSPDAGTYMYYDMTVNREKFRAEEKLSAGPAMACYATLVPGNDSGREMVLRPLCVA